MTQFNSPVLKSLNDELQQLYDLTLAWVETGWRHGNLERFNFRKQLNDYYDWDSGDTQFFDSFDTEQRISHSAADYAAIWDSVVPQLNKLTNKIIGKPNTIISGELAVMDVRFITTFETSDGVVDQADTLSSLVWRRTQNGWRIIREHGTVLVKR